MTSPAYEWARTYAQRRIREGDLPRAAALDAADVYDLSPGEAGELADEMEALPSAGSAEA